MQEGNSCAIKFPIISFPYKPIGTNVRRAALYGTGLLLYSKSMAQQHNNKLAYYYHKKIQLIKWWVGGGGWNFQNKSLVTSLHQIKQNEKKKKVKRNLDNLPAIIERSRCFTAFLSVELFFSYFLCADVRKKEVTKMKEETWGRKIWWATASSSRCERSAKITRQFHNNRSWILFVPFFFREGDDHYMNTQSTAHVAKFRMTCNKRIDCFVMCGPEMRISKTQ